MQKPTKRLFALLLAAVMVVGLLPVSALAARVAEDVTAEVPLGEEVVSASLAERPAVPVDADAPAQLAAADGLTISGYTRVTSLPEGGLDDGYYLLVVPYSGNYYMLYPGATGAAASANNSARLEVDSSDAATGYKVGHGTTYDSATVSTDFSAAENLVAKTGGTKTVGSNVLDLYSVSATQAGGSSTYYLCDGPVYRTAEGTLTISPSTTSGCFYLRVNNTGNSYLIFYPNGTSNMNFNQNSSVNSTTSIGDIMLFKNDTKEPPLPTAQLQSLINEVNALTQADYTPKTWADLQTALTAANSAVSGSDRQAMKTAMDALTAAKNALQAKPTVPTPPAATLTYPEATGTLEDGVYVILAGGKYLYNNGSKTDQWGGSVSNGNLNGAPSDANRILWRITKTSGGYTIRGLLNDNDNYLTSEASGTQRALSASAETFSITNTSGNTYEIKNSAGQYLSFSSSWIMSASGTVALYKQTSTAPKTAEELRPADGATTGQPFPGEGLAGGDFFRIPTIVTVKGHANDALNGTLVAATDMRWKSHLDSSNIDTVVSYSTDNGETWHYSFVNFFGDITLTATANKSALFIDPLLTADNSGNLYLLVNAFPAGVSTHSTSYQRPEETTGFVEIDGVSRMPIYTSPENSAQDDGNYSYYIGDFAPISGSETKYATIWDAYDHSDSGFYVDDHFYLYKKAGATAVPADDIIYCKQMGESNAATDTWVQQNLFFWNATLHVRNAQFLYMVKSSDGGRTWSAPTILNDQVRTGEHQFYGPGPGAGICMDDGTIIIPTYQLDEHSSFIYSNNNGASWNRGPILGWESTENMIVQIDSNTIRQFYRNRNHDLYYADYTRSGGVWTASDAPVFTGQQKQGNNQISALRYSTQIDGKTIIFVSTASNTSSSASGYARKGGKVIAFALNADNTMTYLSTYRINQPTDWYGYSSLTQLTNGDLGIIYENSQNDGSDPNSPGYCGLTYFSISPYAILLPGLIERAEALNEADYTAETWSGLAAPLATAKAVLDGTDAATTLEAAYTALNDALKALRKLEVTISGTVTADSAPVEGAVVTLEDNDYVPVGLTATTDENGAFTFDNNNEADVTLSSAASYKLKVQAPGFTYQVTTVNAAAFNDQKLSSNAITLTARPAATYTNTFDSADSVTVLSGLDGVENPPTAAWQNGAAKITMKTSNREKNNMVYKGMSFSCGTVSFDLTPLSTGVRTGIVLRATSGASRVYAGTFDGTNQWGWEYWPGSNQYGNGTQANIPKLEANVTRHLEVSIDSNKKLTMTVDGVQVIEKTLSSPPSKGFAGLVSNGANTYLVDNFYLRRTDPKSAVTLTATDGTLTGKVIADGVESPLTSGDTVYEGDTVVITGTGDSGKCLGSITLSGATAEVTKTAVEGGGYEFSFVMPGQAVTVTGNFKTTVTGAKIEGRGVVGKDLTATALAGETEIPANGATYKWYHQEQSGTWTPCTAGEAQTKTVKSEDQGKLVKVRVEGTGDYAGWFEQVTDAVIGPKDVETEAVTITRDSITMWKNLDTDPNTDDDTVEGKTTTLTATVDPSDATFKTVVWSSGDENIATVSENGLVTAVGNGTATITATVTSADGTEVSDTVAITVKTGITSITLTKGGAALPSELTIYANDGDANQTVTVNAAVNSGAAVTDLVWACNHEGEHIFQLGTADDPGEATGGTVVISAYNSHTLVGEETVTVSAPATTGNTATAVTFKVKVVHKIDADEHSVSVAGYTGAPKVGDELSANHSNLTPGFQLNKLSYEWIRTKAGTETTVGTDATYTLTADDVGGTIKVKFTATPADGFYYEGSLTSTATAAVEKKDGPAAPELEATDVGDEEQGTITIKNPVEGESYEYKKDDGNWEDVTASAADGKIVITGLETGNYQVRIKENGQHKAGTAETVTVGDSTTTYYNVTVTMDPTSGAGTAVRSAERVAENQSVTLTVTPNPNYSIKSVKNGEVVLTGTPGEGNATEYTVSNVQAAVAFAVTFEKRTVKITHALENMTCDNQVAHDEDGNCTVESGAVTSITLTPGEGYDLPSSIKVTYTDGTEAPTDRCSYTISDGKVIITFPQGVQRNITITAKAIAKTYTASFDPNTGGNLTRAFTSATPIAYNGNLTATLTPATGYSVPAKESVEVTVGGSKVTDFGYAVDSTTGVATITVSNVKGNVVIKAASAVKNTTTITGASINGTPTEGNTLSITGVVPTNATYSVKWQRADAPDGQYANVAATSTYALQSGDVGKYFKAVVSGTGDYSGEVATTAIGPVAAKVIPATGVTITVPAGSNSTVLFGETLSLTATVTPANATANTVKWSSGNTSVATVNENTGVVTPVKVGTATILATVINSDGTDGVTDTVGITVAPAPIALRLTGAAVETKTLTATVTPAGATIGEVVHLFWYRVGGNEDLLLDNNDQTTYTLTSDDIGYPIKVTASVPSGSESNYTGSAVATTPVEVAAVGDEIFVESVTLSKSKASVAVDGTVTLTATVLPSNATNQTVFWVSDNEPVATVDQNGVVTGVTEGTAIISVFTEDGDFTAQCTVTVTSTPVTPSKPSTSTARPSTETPTTETREDGAKVTTVTKPDGTKVETVEEPDGTKAVTETKPDGSKTATVEQPDGTTSETVTTAEGDTTITVTDPEGEELAKVEIPATIPEPEDKFVDIGQTPWAEEAINKVAGLELVKGTGGNKYDPTTPMTRGALATVLHRLSNGKTDYEVAFKDVAANRYYTEGVAWAAKANVVKGISEDIFAPDQIITREQLAVMLARYAKLIGISTKADSKSLEQFADGDTTGAWAVDGMAWCVEKGILKGKGLNNLDPTADVSRAEVAVMLDRFIALIQK